ncbi:MAG: carbamoyltransferase HypF [Pseudomonadota bacterium]
MTAQGLIVQGQVQGVGFRPTVWRLAKELGLTGDVKNTARGVEIRLWGKAAGEFETRLRSALPKLAEIERIESFDLTLDAPQQFEIAASEAGANQISVTPDMAVCADCLEETRDPFQRRYRYPFANCTNCGPRLSIVQSAPYDRATTTMAAFEMCPDCRAEYEDPDDRRFHAQPIACHACGPKAWLEKLGGGAVNLEAFSMMDDVDAAGGALMNGHIVAVKGLGGFHLACDATKAEIVLALRDRKRRPDKPFALMARDLEIIRSYAELSQAEENLLTAPQAPIVLLKAHADALPANVAPGLDRLGFMLPNTPMHHMLLRRMKRPVIMTSGNISGRPQCIDNDEVRRELSDVAAFALFHNRDIHNRVDDSVVRLDGSDTTMLRRARGYAPKPLPLPDGVPADLTVIAMGSELKNTFCLTDGARGILSQHMGDLEDAATFEETARSLTLYRGFYDHVPDAIIVDAHPEYLSTKRGYEIAGDTPVIEVQHHHAHIAACLADNECALDASPVLGVAMDGLGLGDDGTIWGGEFMIADYRGYRRVGHLKPVPLLGGTAAVRDPWRNAYAHLTAEMSWAELWMNFCDLDLMKRLEAAPRTELDAMRASGTNSPLSSSCGRLFDAAATIAGLAWDRQSYEGQAAMAFEAALDAEALNEPEDLAYPFTIPLMGGNGLPYIEPLAVWRAMLGDLLLKTPVGVVSARFHRGLAKAIGQMIRRHTTESGIDTVALSGGCFQNAMLTRLVRHEIQELGLTALIHKNVPANDGGLSLGQAVVGLAHLKEGG